MLLYFFLFSFITLAFLALAFLTLALYFYYCFCILLINFGEIKLTLVCRTPTTFYVFPYLLITHLFSTL